MRFTNTVILLLLFLAGSLVAAQDIKPSLPYLDNGACPFECCTYRRWTVEKDTVIYKQRSTTSGVAFQVKKGEQVTGVTGVVITANPGRVVVKKAQTIGQDRKVRVKPGDILYVLHYQGEGFFKVWFRGKTYDEELPAPPDLVSKTPPAREDANFRVVSEADAVWWVQVRNKRGQIGWTKQTDHFGNMDACG